MHPRPGQLVLPAPARHRRELSTRQQIRVALTVLATIGTVAAVGLFGGNLQTRALTLLAAHAIPFGFVGWAVYGVPLFGLVMVLSPVAAVRLIRYFGYLMTAAGLVALAVMSQPRGIAEADWRSAVGGDFLHSAAVTGYVLLATLLGWILFATVAFAASRPATIEDNLLRLRRSAAVAALIGLIASAIAAATL